MTINNTENPTGTSVLTIGTFDGMHTGHLKLIGKVRLEAKKLGLYSVIVTFDHHPRFTVSPEPDFCILSPTDEKLDMIRSLGIDQTEVLTFSPELASQSAAEFLKNYIIPKYKPALIVVGYDSHFGKQRSGNIKFLKKMSHRYDYRVVKVMPELHNGEPISSSMIRSYLKRGDLDLANKLLARRYSITGEVVKGVGVGRQLGFPTANLSLLEAKQLLPRNGIYLVMAHLDNCSFLGLTNIGFSPTMKSLAKPEVETHLLGFENDIYGRKLKIEFIKRIRDEKRFSSRSELVDAMRNDLAIAERYKDYEVS